VQVSEVQIALDTVRAGLATAEAARTLAKEVERLRAVVGLARIVVTVLDNTGRLHAIDGGPELAAAIRRG